MASSNSLTIYMHWRQISHSLREPAKEKKVKYAARIIEVEHGSFTPLVFSCFGGMSRECSSFYKKLAELLAEKRNIRTSEALCFVRTKISFSLAKSMVLCIRGSRSIRNETTSISETDVKLANSESCVRLRDCWSLRRNQNQHHHWIPQRRVAQKCNF